ncbi:MAG: pilus assembly protein N-terminal domain-containing protein, partial [Acidobacteriota bacterium]|nr:pilus assembly protein N-terminal domain-containing protein [Acidobacteriota bacterium]
MRRIKEIKSFYIKGKTVRYNRPALLILLLMVFSTGVVSANAQNTVTLAKRVLEVKHTDYVVTENATPSITEVKSSNPSVATARAYGTDQVQIVAVALGKTTVTFFDNNAGVRYQVPVWVEAANASGGGGQGYNPGLAQLPQIVMLVKYTQNVTVPGGGTPQISGVVSSNPSVATARTNTASTILIYSVALGDTFIDFTDNATGTTYQVHVWVQRTLSPPSGGPIGGDGKGKGKGKGKGQDQSSDAPPGGGAAPSDISGKLDRCIAGRWTVESQSISNVQTRGGSGAVVTVKTDGSITID